MWSAIMSAMGGWHQGKLFVEHAISISHDSLHVVAGVLCQLLVALLVRRPVSSWIPWLFSFAIILWSEAVDLWVERWPDPGMQYGEGAKDVVLTMALPTILLVVARLRPGVFYTSRTRGRR